MARSIIYGRNPVREIVLDDPSGVEKLIAAAGGRGETMAKLLDLAASRGIEIEIKDRSALDRLTDYAPHQGVVALVRPFQEATLEEIMACRKPSLKGDLVLVVDGVMDPRNLGALIRTAHCFGCNGVVIPRHRAAGVTAAAVKASAGAARLTKVAAVTNIARGLMFLKERGFWIYGADVEGKDDIEDITFEERVALVVGSEGKGIRPLVKRKCDFLLKIPMIGKVQSLNVSVAGGIIMYTACRAMTRRG
ncbi:MAG TPA: 23S rRNA (guanosine(2251)-2'-O)-methyltransferase RlmB [Syntrophales bacterium]|nr:23S rRNA (guanosine(2251)-2'-O)-methyltransferase RlmB [Syntrophales bacterium]HOM06750.1 23S rRNA (guanosine(2251)-2'-O)-methyltransferase RlmB [Syntrophales bacterium]HOO00072.1 23S rRNA (guanosine(2251)-2'-O)-methyltransferase RlmB [Syntrophales bacterium]HPC01659.1 23S rRNA (guanosine(2251)-2'-O)-methyltransferase RlmB [Syntrophales bacterium]HPQ06092.1 23S rRNA (guanosine(2251)-2'-O)-methyltransferase RlmB [Syntrophales bacterium]